MCLSKGTTPSTKWFITTTYIAKSPWLSFSMNFITFTSHDPSFLIKSRLLWLIGWQKWQILSWPSKIVACEGILKFFIDDIHACTMACHIKLFSFIMDYNSSLLFEKGGLIFGVLNHFFLSQSSTNRYVNFKCKLNMK